MIDDHATLDVTAYTNTNYNKLPRSSVYIFWIQTISVAM